MNPASVCPILAWCWRYYHKVPISVLLNVTMKYGYYINTMKYGYYINCDSWEQIYNWRGIYIWQKYQNIRSLLCEVTHRLSNNHLFLKCTWIGDSSRCVYWVITLKQWLYNFSDSMEYYALWICKFLAEARRQNLKRFEVGNNIFVSCRWALMQIFDRAGGYRGLGEMVIWITPSGYHALTLK